MQQTFRVVFDNKEESLSAKKLEKLLLKKAKYPVKATADKGKFCLLVTITDPSGDGMDELTEKLNEVGVFCWVEDPKED